ncbi:Gfo/Idh/MocA family oxidoreductase [Desulfovibrio sp. OttesenSCG-928-C06]|nr:Gfo/Idh/MocA family oxidoreductase [Desulfovibrio sp. OttesenSCG-928-C06]
MQAAFAKCEQAKKVMEAIKMKRSPYDEVTILGAGEVFQLKIKECLSSLGVKKFNIYDPGLYPDIDWHDFKLVGPVFILSPNHLHLQQLRHVLHHGSACYVEKPMVINCDELETLAKLMRDASSPVYFGDYYFFKALPLLCANGHLRQYKSFVMEQGRYDHSINDVVAVEAQILEGGCEKSGTIEHRNWLTIKSAGGGMLLDLLIHITNILNLLGLHLESVSNSSHKYFSHESGKYEPIVQNDRAEDYAGVEGYLTGDIPVKLRVGKYAAEHSRYIKLHHANGDITALYFEKKNFAHLINAKGDIPWYSELKVNPYLLTMRDALTFFKANQSKKYSSDSKFYAEQSLSIEQIAMIGEALEVNTSPAPIVSRNRV